jgi:glycosyltransferase involved in cell wall biosynthesis
MKILAIAFAYNEIKYIAEMVNYYRSQGCDLNIVDNCSTDGTFQWLQAHGVRTRQKDTNQTFDLKTLQRCLVNDINAVKPDWVVYTGIDIYYIFDGTIREVIEEADRKGFNMISVQYFNMYNTGEQSNGSMKDTYFFARKFKRLYMIAKYQNPFGFEADSIQIKNRKIYDAPGVFINYGNCKPFDERETTYGRRKRAWDAGLDRNYGVHYLEGRTKGWIWKRSELIDIRETEYYKYIQKIC